MRDPSPFASHTAFIAFGGNQGPVLHHFRTARQALQRRAGHVVAVSRLYRTVALRPAACVPPSPPQADYYNAVCHLETRLDPFALLRLLQRLELEAGRRRSAPWAARPLDLDLLAYDGVIVRSHALTLPHPGLSQRPFVLQPLCDVAAAYPLPPAGQTPQQMRAALAIPFDGILAILPWDA
jgi:2-amino-4-hydroxy-6-hydroxymethyldihydropteridine diphosphokinase